MVNCHNVPFSFLFVPFSQKTVIDTPLTHLLGQSMVFLAFLVILRIEYLWLNIPYLSVIGVNEEYQRKGIGTAVIEFLGRHLLKQGHKVLYSSSQANENGVSEIVEFAIR